MNNKQEAILKILHTYFVTVQSSNKSFSLRSFANFLKISPASLSLFFNKKREFSDKSIEQILKKIGYSEIKIRKFFNSYAEGPEITLKRNISRKQMAEELFYIVADPIYYTLLALFETGRFKFDVNTISKRVDESKERIQTAIGKLLELGFISIDEKTTFIRIETEHLEANLGVSSKALRERHEKNLKDATEALLHLPLDERYFCFETLAINKKKLPEVQKLFDYFLDELHKIAQSENKKDVYEFCFQYFPRTKKVVEKNE